LWDVDRVLAHYGWHDATDSRNDGVAGYSAEGEACSAKPNGSTSLRAAAALGRFAVAVHIASVQEVEMAVWLKSVRPVSLAHNAIQALTDERTRRLGSPDVTYADDRVN
jgi:hypothetical protein